MFFLFSNLFKKSCELEIRQRKGEIIQIHTGCKQIKACENNMDQNFIGKYTSLL